MKPMCCIRILFYLTVLEIIDIFFAFKKILSSKNDIFIWHMQIESKGFALILFFGQMYAVKLNMKKYNLNLQVYIFKPHKHQRPNCLTLI